jgi:hypothetical protein
MDGFSEPSAREFDVILPLVANGGKRAFGHLYDLSPRQAFCGCTLLFEETGACGRSLEEGFYQDLAEGRLL